MRDLGERVGLVHELGELRAAEELAHGRRHRLGVDQVVRHRRIDLDRAHPLAHGTLHAEQADAELVLHQLADRAHPAVAQMVDVVDLAAAVLDLDQRADDLEDVLGAQHAQRVVRLHVETGVHLHPADGREVVALGIEDQAVEEGLGRLQRRRLARAQHAVDVEQRLLAARGAVEHQRVADVGADAEMVDVEHRDLGHAGLAQAAQHLARELVAGLGMDQAVLRVDEVAADEAADQVLGRVVDLGHALLLETLEETRAQLGAGLGQRLAGAGVDQVGDDLLALEPLGAELGLPALAGLDEQDLAVEGAGGSSPGRGPGPAAASSPAASGGGRCGRRSGPWRRTRNRARSRDRG